MEGFLLICGIIVVFFIYSHVKTGKNLYKQNIISSIVTIQQNPSLLADGLIHSMGGSQSNPVMIVCIFLTTFCFIVKQSSEVNDRDKSNIVSIILEDTNLIKDLYSTYISVIKFTAVKGRIPEAVDMKTFIDIANNMVYKMWN